MAIVVGVGDTAGVFVSSFWDIEQLAMEIRTKAIRIARIRRFMGISLICNYLIISMGPEKYVSRRTKCINCRIGTNTITILDK